MRRSSCFAFGALARRVFDGPGRVLAAGIAASALACAASADVVQYDQYTGLTNFFAPNLAAGNPVGTGYNYMGVAITLADPGSLTLTGFDVTFTNGLTSDGTSTGTPIALALDGTQSLRLQYWIWNTADVTDTAGTTPAFSNLAGSGAVVLVGPVTYNANSVNLYGSWPATCCLRRRADDPRLAAPVIVTSAGPIGVTLNWQINRNDGNGYVDINGGFAGLTGGNGNVNYPAPVVGVNNIQGYFRSNAEAGGDGLGDPTQMPPFPAGNFQISSRRPQGAGVNSGVPLRVYAQAATTGACCSNNTGTCVLTSATGCLAGNTFQGAGNACPGATCAANAVCCDTGSGACTIAYGGSSCPTGTTTGAAGTSCVPTSCPASGACCSGVTCTQVLDNNGAPSCAGTYVGVNTVCSPTNACFPADECQGTNLVATVGSQFGDSTGATTSTTLAFNLCGIYGGSGGEADIFLTFTPPATAAYKIDTCGSNYDTVLSVHSGCPANAANLLACNDDFGATSTCVDGSTPATGYSVIDTVTLTAGTLYYIRIAGFNAATGGWGLDIGYNDPTAPLACCSGASCSLTDSANCTGTLGTAQTCSPSPCGGATGVCCRGGRVHTQRWPTRPPALVRWSPARRPARCTTPAPRRAARARSPARPAAWPTTTRSTASPFRTSSTSWATGSPAALREGWRRRHRRPLGRAEHIRLPDELVRRRPLVRR